MPFDLQTWRKENLKPQAGFDLATWREENPELPPGAVEVPGVTVKPRKESIQEKVGGAALAAGKFPLDVLTELLSAPFARMPGEGWKRPPSKTQAFTGGIISGATAGYVKPGYEEAEELHPKSKIAGELAGLAAPFTAAGKVTAPIKLPSLVREMAMGGLYGGLRAKETEGESRVKNALIDAAAFGAFGLVLRGLGKFIAKPVLNRISQRLATKEITQEQAIEELTPLIDKDKPAREFVEEQIARFKAEGKAPPKKKIPGKADEKLPPDLKEMLTEYAELKAKGVTEKPAVTRAKPATKPTEYLELKEKVSPDFEVSPSHDPKLQTFIGDRFVDRLGKRYEVTTEMGGGVGGVGFQQVVPSRTVSGGIIWRKKGKAFRLDEFQIKDHLRRDRSKLKDWEGTQKILTEREREAFVPELKAEPVTEKPAVGKPPPEAGRIMPPKEGVLPGIQKMIAEAEVKVDPTVVERVSPAPLPKYAGSINLERIDVEDQFKGLVFKASKEEPKFKTTFKQIVADSKELGLTQAQVKALADEIGQGKLSSIIHASRQGFIDATFSAGKLLNQLPEETLRNPAMLKKAQDVWLNYVKSVFAPMQTLSGETGRALGIHRKIVAPQRKLIKHVQNIIEGMEGDYGKQAEYVEKLVKLDWTNPQEIRNFAMSMTKPKFMEYLYSWWYNSILSGIPTHIINMQGNTLWGLFQTPIKGIRALVDIPVAKLQRRPREYFLSEIVPSWVGMAKGMPKSIAKSFEMMKKGYVEGELTKWQKEMYTRIGAFERSPYKALRIAGKPIELPGRALQSADLFFKGIAFDSHIHELATRRAMKQAIAKGLTGAKRVKYVSQQSAKLIQEPRANMVKAAKEYAEYLTFMDAPGKIAGTILKMRDVVPGGRFVVPFVTTIGNLIKRGVELTPGLGVAIQRGQLKGPELSNVIAKQVLGGLGTLYFAMKYLNGELTGMSPKNRAEREAWWRQGKMPWAMKIGDAWVSYRRVEPFNTFIASVASVGDAWKDRGELPPEAVIMKMSTSLGRNLLDASYLSGFSDVLRTLETGQRATTKEALLKYPARQIGGFLPFSSFQRSIVKAVEAGKTGEAIVKRPVGIPETVKSQIPFLAGTVPTKKTVWGEPSRIEGGPLRQFLPVKGIKEKKDPVETEIKRLSDKGLIGYPGEVSKKIKDVELSRKEWDWYLVKAGQLAKSKLDKFVKLKIYRQMTDEIKAKYIKKIINDARKKARERLWLHIVATNPERVKE